MLSDKGESSSNFGCLFFYSNYCFNILEADFDEDFFFDLVLVPGCLNLNSPDESRLYTISTVSFYIAFPYYSVTYWYSAYKPNSFLFFQIYSKANYGSLLHFFRAIFFASDNILNLYKDKAYYLSGFNLK